MHFVLRRFSAERMSTVTREINSRYDKITDKFSGCGPGATLVPVQSRMSKNLGALAETKKDQKQDGAL